MITKEEILNRTTDYKIFCHYNNGSEIINGKKIHSPLRSEINPSFNFYKNDEGFWRFNDYGGEQGDSFQFVMLLHNISFAEALQKINDDMELGIVNNSTPDINCEVHKPITDGKYTIYPREALDWDLEYWGQYGSSSEILSRYGVIFIAKKSGVSKISGKSYSINSNRENLMYAYPYSNDCYKIYQPKAKKQHRFFYLSGESRDKEFVFGLNQINPEQKQIIWASGEKDVMTWRGIGFNAVTSTSESGTIPKNVLKKLQNEDYEIVIILDNDKTGMEKSEKFSAEYQLKRAVLPEMPEFGKDISDYVKLKLPIENITTLIQSAEICISKGKPDKPKIGKVEIVNDDDGNYSLVILADSEFTYDIWFFQYSKNGEPVLKGLYRHGIMLKLNEAGFYKLCRENDTYIFIREVDNIIIGVEVFMMTNWLQKYIDEQFKDGLLFEHRGSKVEVPYEKLQEIFLRQSHTICNPTFMTQLVNHTKPILRDDRYSTFFFFKNIVVKVTAEGIEYLPYNTIQGFCIWYSRIIIRDFVYEADNKFCHFSIFINNVSNNEGDRIAAFISSIGYLLHNYNHPTGGQAVIANDEEITDTRNPQGGTGKGVYSNGIKQIRDVSKIDGKKYNPDDKFKFQTIKLSTQVCLIDDVKNDFKFDSIHSCLTDGINVEYKHLKEIFIKPEDSPKFLITSNTAISGGGSTNKRRMFVLEFANHYSKNINYGVEEPIKDEHGCTFFDNDDWDQKEWNKFYSYMIDCSITYMQKGLQTYKHRTLEHNRLKQKTSEEFYEWVQAQNFQPNVEYKTHEYMSEFLELYYGSETDFKQRGFTNWLMQFAESKNWIYKYKRSNSVAKFMFLDKAKKQPDQTEAVPLIPKQTEVSEIKKSSENQTNISPKISFEPKSNDGELDTIPLLTQTIFEQIEEEERLARIKRELLENPPKPDPLF